MVTSLFDIGYAFGACPISRLLINLYASGVAQLCRIVSLFLKLSSGSLCPESSVLTTFFGWLSLGGLVAHFAPDWWLSMVRIIHTSANSALIHPISNIKDNIRQSWGAGGRKFESSHPDKHTKALPVENG